jgi:hypothetical protein
MACYVPTHALQRLRIDICWSEQQVALYHRLPSQRPAASVARRALDSPRGALERPPPRPTTRPSSAQTVCMATWHHKSPAEGPKYPSSVPGAVPLPLSTRLTRLSSLVPAGTAVAIVGRGVLWRATLPRRNAARVVKGRAIVPGGLPGYPGVKASGRVRDLCGGCPASPPPAGLVALSRGSRRCVTLVNSYAKMTWQMCPVEKPLWACVLDFGPFDLSFLQSVIPVTLRCPIAFGDKHSCFGKLPRFWYIHTVACSNFGFSRGRRVIKDILVASQSGG